MENVILKLQIICDLAIYVVYLQIMYARSINLIFAMAGLLMSAQDISHPTLGTSVTSPGGLKLTLVDRRQNYNYSEPSTLCKSIISPKSINIHPSGAKYYVNSLEGASTVVFDASTNEQTAKINHKFNNADSELWAPESGYYKFSHYSENLRTFRGRPVESAFSHNGRYLWVPYYRRSFDINAQDPSALAVIDTRTDTIVRLMECGVLPKMIAVSPDSRHVAVADWGDNTVGYIHCPDSDPASWHHERPFVIDRQLKWDLSLTESVNRDSNSGNALRGTVFTADGRYLLVGCMGGMGGIAVIDTQSNGESYLGKIYGMMPNVRHIIISGNYLYLSVNKAGYVQRLPMRSLMSAISRLKDSEKKAVTVSQGWESAKVGEGARTIVSSPKGRFIFAACNIASTLDVVDTKTMRKVLSLPLDSYPVGLDISADGKTIYVTSQGRKDKIPSGNCVDIIRVDY
jgi:DNA-binding beta-propeller fold protein YncE